IHEPAVICPYMVRPSASSSQNFSQVAHAGTSIALLISTRGAHSCVRKIPTGFPDWMRSVSSDSKACRLRTIASKHAQLRAALPVPPYTMRSSGFSATSGSKLFISIRSAASCSQPLQLSLVPRGARTRRPAITLPPRLASFSGGPPASCKDSLNAQKPPRPATHGSNQGNPQQDFRVYPYTHRGGADRQTREKVS